MGTIIGRADFSRIPPMPYASFAAACRTLWNLSRASYFIPIQVSGPEFMLKISAREFMPTPDCVAATKMRYIPRREERETKRGEKQWEPSTG